MKNSKVSQCVAWCVAGLATAWPALVLATSTVNQPAYSRETAPPQMPANVSGREAVKQYVVIVSQKAQDAGKQLKVDATEYAGLVAAHGNDVVAAAHAEPQHLADLMVRMRDDYKGIHNFGYEYIEGIVGGVPQLIKYDIELDGGVPAAGAAITDQVAPVVVHTPSMTIDREGSLNSYLIEAAVYGTNPKFVAGSAPLPGFEGKVRMPKPELMTAFADYAIDGYGRLHADALKWQPSDRDFFEAMFTMTPTLSDYFDDWKETKKYGSASGGRFIGVSRVSDMRGILGSTRLTWESEMAKVQAKDPALAGNIDKGYAQIMKFIDVIYDREAVKPLKIETIDALGSQAKEKADHLTVEVAQAAAVLGIDVNSK